ncbi:MAG: NAD(P)-dependent oxidoreductase [Pseudomonadota bacterium]
MKIGFVGLGAMGAPMTAKLSAAFPGAVRCFDADPARLAAVADESGAQAAGSVAELARAVDLVFTCLPNDTVLRAVYLGPGGLADQMMSHAISVDCSTVSPAVTQEVALAVSDFAHAHLDAAMLGSVKQANEGTISFVVGGDAQALETARPALAACGGLIRHCGPSGAGQRMKLVHQTLVAGHAVAVAEALGLCLETGIDIEAFYEIVTQGTGFAYSRYFENRVPRMRQGEFAPLFALDFMLKDARLARDMAGPAADAFPALAAVIDTLEAAQSDGHGAADFSAAMKAVEARLGKTVDGRG